MGGGVVARYLGTYGSAGVSKAVFISAVAGGPHGLTWTHAEKVNAEPVAFLM
jgi:hypothetical protein